MENLIEDLLSYARAGKRSGDFVDVDVEQMFENILEFFLPKKNTQHKKREISCIDPKKYCEYADTQAGGYCTTSG